MGGRCVVGKQCLSGSCEKRRCVMQKGGMVFQACTFGVGLTIAIIVVITIVIFVRYKKRRVRVQTPGYFREYFLPYPYRREENEEEEMQEIELGTWV